MRLVSFVAFQEFRSSNLGPFLAKVVKPWYLEAWDVE